MTLYELQPRFKVVGLKFGVKVTEPIQNFPKVSTRKETHTVWLANYDHNVPEDHNVIIRAVDGNSVTVQPCDTPYCQNYQEDAKTIQGGEINIDKLTRDKFLWKP